MGLRSLPACRGSRDGDLQRGARLRRTAAAALAAFAAATLGVAVLSGAALPGPGQARAAQSGQPVKPARIMIWRAQGRAGVPRAPAVVYSEAFEHGMGAAPVALPRLHGTWRRDIHR
jgi:hypothetical protein